VANLDDDGDPIAGESYTMAGGFTFQRPDMTAETGAQWITRQLMLNLRRMLIDNVAVSASPDWTDAPAQLTAAIGDLPAILLEGPEFEENTFYRYSDVFEGTFDDGIGRNAHPWTGDLTWDIILIGRNKPEALNLCDAAIRYIGKRRPRFRFPAGPADPTIVEVRWYLENWVASDRLPDQVFMYESRLRLEGLHLDDVDGMPVDEVVTYETVDAETGFLELETGAIE
jgi:hypothetical protein